MKHDAGREKPARNPDAHESAVQYDMVSPDERGQMFLSSTAFQKALLDAVPVPIFFKDTSGKYLIVNRAFAARLRLPEAELLGKTVFDIAPPELAAKYHAMDTALMEQPGTQVYEHGLSDFDGVHHDVIFHKATFAGKDGTVQGIFGVILDATESRRAEALLKKANEELDLHVQQRTAELLEANKALEQEIAERSRAEKKLSLFRELVNQSGEAMFVVDVSSSRILEVNDAAMPLLGFVKEELLNMKVTDIAESITSEADWIQHREELKRKKRLFFEDKVRRKDGTFFPAEVSVKYFIHAGSPFVFAVLHDISRRKEMESHIMITNEVLRLSSENISRQQYVDALGKLIKEWCNCSTAAIRIAGDAQSCSSQIVCSSFSGQCPEELHIEHMTEKNCACFRALNGDMFPAGSEVVASGRSFFVDDTDAFMNVLPLRESAFFHPYCLLRKYGSVAVIPVSYQNAVLGLIVFADEQKGAISRITVEVLESLSPVIAEALCRHNKEEELKQSSEQMRSLAAHIQEVREEERTRIAREIHDQLGQILTALKIDLSWVRQQCAGNDEIHAKTKSMMSLVNQTILTVKKIVTELRPSVLDHLGIGAAIEWQVGEIQKLTGVRCTVELMPEKIILGKGVATNIFRVFQEIMTNILRHADATETEIRLENTSEGLTLRVSDNGKGASEKQLSAPTSYGILGIRERVRSMGGKIDFMNAEPHGLVAQVFVPSDSLHRAWECGVQND